MVRQGSVFAVPRLSRKRFLVLFSKKNCFLPCFFMDSSMLEGPEIESHRHRTGHSRIDFMMGATAVLLSCVSIFIAVNHGRTMERLVAANSWPNLSYSTGNSNDLGTNDDITLDIRNSGVGPARLDSMQVFYKGVAQSSGLTLLQACCGTKKTFNFGANIVLNEVLPARETTTFLRVARAANGNGVWDALNRERLNISVKLCYCSVFEECWMRDSRSRRPERVDKCSLPEAENYAVVPPPKS
jgi:hypothetical protein